MMLGITSDFRPTKEEVAVLRDLPERAAAQLDLCLRALGGGKRGIEGAVRGRAAAGLVTTYAKQLTLLGQLHAQAHREPVERALDDGRRGELLALTQDLFDASLRAPRFDPGETDAAHQDEEAAHASLRAALLQQDQAIVASITASAQALRGADIEPGPALGEARAAVEAGLDEIRGQRETARAASAQQADAFLAHLASRRELATRQLAIEAWLADWHAAAAAQRSAIG